jgi:hypothetical protein
MSTYEYFTRSLSNLIHLNEDDKPYDGHHMYNSVDIGDNNFNEYLEYIIQNDTQNDTIQWRNGKIINYSKIIDNKLSGNVYENFKVKFITTMKKEYGIVTFQILYKYNK